MASKVIILYEDEFEMYEHCKQYVEHTLTQIERREREKACVDPHTPIFKTSDYLKSILGR